MSKYLDGVISATAVSISSSTASGMWSTAAHAYAIHHQVWPVTIVTPSPPTFDTITLNTDAFTATIPFTPPGNAVLSKITSYTLYRSDEVSYTQATSPFVISLTPNTTDSFRIASSNITGPSPLSEVSAKYIILRTPTPGIPVFTGTQVSLPFIPNDLNNSGVSTTYTAISIPGGLTGSSTGSPITVTGLTAGVNYKFNIRAENSYGRSSYVQELTVADAPTITSVSTGHTVADIAFTAPAYNGYSPITSYTATLQPGNFTATAATSPITVTGLTNLSQYSITLVATNEVGSGVGAVSTVTPVPIPNAPTLSSIQIADTLEPYIFVSLSSPTINGSNITLYTVIAYDVNTGDNISISTNSTGIFANYTNGLSYGHSYTFTAYATNSYGRGPTSSILNATPVQLYNPMYTVTLDLSYLRLITWNSLLYQWNRPINADNKPKQLRITLTGTTYSTGYIAGQNGTLNINLNITSQLSVAGGTANWSLTIINNGNIYGGGGGLGALNITAVDQGAKFINNGLIVGGGGAGGIGDRSGGSGSSWGSSSHQSSGGNGIYPGSAITIINNGVIAGGGGGGASGTTFFSGGGGGGGGAPYGPAGSGQYSAEYLNYGYTWYQGVSRGSDGTSASRTVGGNGGQGGNASTNEGYYFTGNLFYIVGTENGTNLYPASGTTPGLAGPAGTGGWQYKYGANSSCGAGGGGGGAWGSDGGKGGYPNTLYVTRTPGGKAGYAVVGVAYSPLTNNGTLYGSLLGAFY
jgi:hypothetical protein